MRTISSLLCAKQLCWLALGVAGLGCQHRGPRVVPDQTAAPVVVPASARRSLALTIYAADKGSGDFGYAFVREQRVVRIPAGRFRLQALEVASTIVPETTRFQLLSRDDDGNAQVAGELYEQRYLYDQLGPKRLLEKSEGQRITATWWAGGRSGHEQSLSGVLLSGKAQPLIRTDTGETLAVPWHARISMAALPPDLVEKPTLSWNVGSYEPTDALLSLTYRAERFNWTADYIVVMNSAAQFADIEGWVTITNHADTAFDRAGLQLAVGEVHTVTRQRDEAEGEVERKAFEKEPEPTHATSEKLGEIHLYSIDHLTDLPARSAKQVRFVTTRGVPIKLEARTKTRLETGNYPAMLTAEIEHGPKGGLAVPLPGGTVRTSTLSSQGLLVQVGEQAADHTPVGEPWRVPIAADPEQTTQVTLRNDTLLSRDRDKAGIFRSELQYVLVNHGRSSRHRTVVLQPEQGRLLKISQTPGLRLEGPTRAVLEVDLAPGAKREFLITVERADPSVRPHRWNLPTEGEVDEE